MTKTLLIASLFAIALTACSKKEEAPAEVVTPPAASAPAADAMAPEAPASAPAADAMTPAAPADAPAK